MFRTMMFSMIVSMVAMTACVADQDGAASTAPAGTVQVIRTAQDLDAHLRAATRSPLDRLSPLARQRFLDSLVFSDTGLGGFQYSDLEAELSPDEINQILGLFAMERVTPMITSGAEKGEGQRSELQQGADHLHFYCESPGTCAPKIGYICTSNC